MSEHTGEQPVARRTPVAPVIPRSSSLRALLGVLDLVATGQYAEADEAARELSFGSLVWGLATPITLPVGLLSAHWSEIRRRPALLGLAALVRQQISGDVAAMDADLSRAARLLQKEGTNDFTRRVSNLALAALCLLLSSQPDEAVATAQRAAALLADITEKPGAADPAGPAGRADPTGATDPTDPTEPADPTNPGDPATAPPPTGQQRLASAACDLAGIFAVVGDSPQASRLWSWVRSVVSDPSSPLLAQVDVGLSCAASFIGDRTKTSSLGHRAVAADHHQGLWRALVMSARCYDALDDLSPRRALDASRSAVDMLPDPYALGSLVSAHVTALIASGRPDWAVDFLAAVDEHGSPSSDASGLGQTRSLLRVAANAAAGNASAAAAHEQRMPPGSPLFLLASAYRSLWDGRPGEAAEAAGDIRDGLLSPRLESLRRVISAAARLRAGHDELALGELLTAGAIAELQGVRWAMLMIPRADVAALTVLAATYGAHEVLRHFPDAENVQLEAVPRVDLTQRETEILDLVARGLTNAEIAVKVFISANTVKYHLTRIYRRLGVTTRDEAVAFTYRLRAAGANPQRDDGG